MAREYDRRCHSHVVVKHPDPRNKDAWREPIPILLHTVGFVWIAADYWHDADGEVRRVGDGRNNGFDEDGNCILSVPASWCTYCTEEEATIIMQMIDSDAELLGFAVG